MNKPWCYWQTKCVEDIEPDSWTCTAHMHEGRAFRCPKANMDAAQKWPGRCEDAKPTKEESDE